MIQGKESSQSIELGFGIPQTMKTVYKILKQMGKGLLRNLEEDEPRKGYENDKEEESRIQ